MSKIEVKKISLRLADAMWCFAKHIQVETVTATLAVVWGAFIANPFISTFERQPRLFAPMMNLVGYEAFWGAIFMALGAAAFACCCRNRARYAALINAVTFIFLALLFALGDTSVPTFLVYATIGLFNFILWRANRWKTRLLNG